MSNQTGLDLASLQNTIDATLAAIREGTEHVQTIVENTMVEMRRLEDEYDVMKQQCLDAVEQVEQLDSELKRARQRLLVVNRDVERYGESDMRDAYDAAQTLQVELAQWQERELQLRLRRDDIARRLKSLRITAQAAEILMTKFHHVTSYLNAEFDVASTALLDAQMQSLLGMQILQMQETERANLAEKLHDGPMQTLASAAMRLPSGDLPPMSSQGTVRVQLGDVITQLRNIVFHLRPPLLDDLGLVTTLKRYIKQWSDTTGIPSHVQLVGMETPLSQTQKIVMFRVVEEALVNVESHACANQVKVLIVYGLDRLRITVDDDGTGIGQIDFTGWLKVGKSGLSLCQQRLRLLSGELRAQPGPNTGTQIIAELPIVREDVLNE